MTGVERARRRFRPTLWSSVAAAGALAVLVGLGTWQVQRLHWKEAVIAHREARLAQAPVALGGKTGEDSDIAFRRARATGRFLHASEFLVVNRVRKGRAGFDVVTPLRIGPADHILVNRGWVPSERADPGTRKAGQIPGTVSVTGVLRRPGKNNRWIPDNDPAKSVWYFVEPEAMAAADSLAGVRNTFLIADAAANPGGFPIGRRIGVEIDQPPSRIRAHLVWARPRAGGDLHTLSLAPRGRQCPGLAATTLWKNASP